MSIFLSKKAKLALEKQQIAEAMRKAYNTAKATKEAEQRKLLEDKDRALQRYLPHSLQAIEEDLQSELAKKLLRKQSKSFERRPKIRFFHERGKTTVEVSSGFSGSEFIVTEQGGKETKPATPIETQGHHQETDPQKSIERADLEQPQPKDQHIPASQSTQVRYAKGKTAKDRLPPPSIPYSTRTGDQLTVHIVGDSPVFHRVKNRKQSLEVKKTVTETAVSLTEDDHRYLSRDQSPTTDFSVTPRLVQKHSIEGDASPLSDNKKKRRECSTDSSPEARHQFHVFRDVSMDEYFLSRVKVNKARGVVLQRIRQYSLRTKQEFPPLPNERKRLELELILERAKENHAQKRFRRVGLQCLLKSGM